MYSDIRPNNIFYFNIDIDSFCLFCIMSYVKEMKQSLESRAYEIFVKNWNENPHFG